MYRGGNWNNGANAGVFYLNGNNSRSNANTNIGFRAALALFVYFLRAKAQQKHQGKMDAFPGRQGQRYTLGLLCRWRPPGTPSKPRRLAVVCYAGRRGIRILRRGDRRGKISPRNVTTRAIIMTTQGGIMGHCSTHGLQKWIEKNIIFKRKEMADIELPQEVTQWELNQF